MPEQIFLPYEFVDSALEFKPHSIVVDGVSVDLAEIVEAERSQMHFAGREEWETAELRFQLSDPNNLLPDLLLPGEKAENALEILAILRNSDTRIRTAARLRAAGESKWAGELSLLREVHRGASAVEFVALRRWDGPQDGRHAFRAHERVATGAPWTIYIDDKPLMPGGAIDGEWRYFARDALVELQRRNDCAWFLDLRDASHPRLFLNEGIDGLKRALEAGQRTGRAARVRDAISHSILQPVLMAMGVEAIESSKEVELDELSGWQRSLLFTFARQCDGKTEEIQVEQWLASWRSGETSVVLVDFETAIQRHVGMADATRHLICELEQSSDG